MTGWVKVGLKVLKQHFPLQTSTLTVTSAHSSLCKGWILYINIYAFSFLVLSELCVCVLGISLGSRMKRQLCRRWQWIVKKGRKDRCCSRKKKGGLSTECVSLGEEIVRMPKWNLIAKRSPGSAVQRHWSNEPKCRQKNNENFHIIHLGTHL